MQITALTPLKEILKLAPACSCDECNHGCKMGSGFLVDDDKKKLARFLKVTEKQLEKKYLEETILFNKKLFRPKHPKSYGRCIFYKNNNCQIHKVKPLQCKIAMGCKDYGEDLTIWFMLNHMVDRYDPESIRQYAQYLEAGGKTIKGGKLNDLVPSKKKLKQILSYKILK